MKATHKKRTINFIWRNYFFVLIVSFLLFIELFSLISACFAQFQIPTQLQPSSSPDSLDSTLKDVTIRVIVLRIDSQDSEGEKLSSGDIGEVLSYLPESMRNERYVKVFDEKRVIKLEAKEENTYVISDVSRFTVTPIDVDYNSQLVLIDTNLQTINNDSPIIVVKAKAKVGIGDYLLYSNLEFDDAINQVILTVSKNDENKQSPNDSQNPENREGEDSKDGESSKDELNSENKNEDKKDISDVNSNKDNQKNEGEQQNEKGDQSNKQILLLLKSLEEVDEREQKEMLNQREKIELPEKWW
ncbi:MAG: hypothetical protein N3G21_04135 [Candidatus Hydrogenedentes bacterium]|nr:hypothetical protein [Candidatus Hydrogenedentota bacterium]